ncbi:hypothetical protein C8Q79DRAFT_986348, partial [Trametes meyenii]
MSATAQDTALFESFFINNCCGVVIPALLAYEYLITFDREVHLFWRSSFTGASVLFFLNRYLPLITIILELCQMLRMSDENCNSFVILTGVVSVLQYIPWAAFSALRVFALSGHHWALSALTLLLSGVPIIINYVRYHWLESLNDPVFGCRTELTLTMSLAKRLVFTVVSRTCLIVADLLVMAVTWNTTRSGRRLRSASQGQTFSSTLLRNGLVYFLILLLMNVLHLTFAMLSVNQAFVKVSYVTIFTEPLTAVLVSRFLFNLQEAGNVSQECPSIARTTDQLDTNFVISSTSFSTIVGWLGVELGNTAASSQPRFVEVGPLASV